MGPWKLLGDDDSGDDHYGLPGDDDDSAPPYEGEIDMDEALMYGECTPTVESVPDGPTPEGWFEFEIELRGWAMDCRINFFDGDSDYCEAWDPITGEPCESDGYVRGGWKMYNDSYGWDEIYGFWDYWFSTIDYVMDLPEADATGESIFICEDAHAGAFATEFCCQDDYTEVVGRKGTYATNQLIRSHRTSSSKWTSESRGVRRASAFGLVD